MSAYEGILEIRHKLTDPTKWNRTGGYAQGTACIVTAGFYVNSESFAKIRKVIVWKYGRTRYTDSIIIDFNDHPDTTHQDVLAVLDEAARQAQPLWMKIREFIRGLF